MLADANYDSRKLFAAVERPGAWLLTPVKGEARAPGTFKSMPESRRQAVQLWRRLRRVRLWIDVKIAVYHARLLARMALNACG